MGGLPKLLSDIRGAIGALWQNPNLRRLLVDRRGAVAVIVALAATALIGFTALGVETGLWYTIKRQNQSAADVAALSGAYERTAGKAYSDICAEAENEAAANGFTFNSFTCLLQPARAHHRVKCAPTIRLSSAAPATNLSRLSWLSNSRPF